MSAPVPSMPHPPTAAWAAELARYVVAARKGSATDLELLTDYLTDPSWDVAKVDTWRAFAEGATSMDPVWGPKLGAAYVAAGQTIADDAERAELTSWWGQLRGAAAGIGEDIGTIGATVATDVRAAGSLLGALFSSPLGWGLALGGGLYLLRRSA